MGTMPFCGCGAQDGKVTGIFNRDRSNPEDHKHHVGDPPTQLALFPNSPGYRLILNNILFPAAKKKERKT